MNSLGQPLRKTLSFSGGDAEQYWPDMEGLDHRETVTDFALPTGTFFDCATVHVLTTATLNRLREFHPEGRFEVHAGVVEFLGVAQPTEFVAEEKPAHTEAVYQMRPVTTCELDSE